MEISLLFGLSAARVGAGGAAVPPSAPVRQHTGGRLLGLLPLPASRFRRAQGGAHSERRRGGACRIASVSSGWRADLDVRQAARMTMPGFAGRSTRQAAWIAQSGAPRAPAQAEKWLKLVPPTTRRHGVDSRRSESSLAASARRCRPPCGGRRPCDRGPSAASRGSGAVRRGVSLTCLVTLAELVVGRSGSREFARPVAELP